MTGIRRFVWVGVVAVGMVLAAAGGVASAGDWGPGPWPAQLRLGGFAGLGGAEPGAEGFANLFVPFWGDSRALAFLDATGRMDDDDAETVSVGVGFRWMHRTDWILGANAYYDHDWTRFGNDFDRMGLGVEVLGRWVEARANGYLAVGDGKERVRRRDFVRSANGATVTYRAYEEALEGLDVEVGVLVPVVSDRVETRVFAGGYWFDSDVGDNLEGFLGRLEVRPNAVVCISVEVLDDDDRGTDTFLGGWINIPLSADGVKDALASLGSIFRFSAGPRTVAERMVQRVVRDPRVFEPLRYEKRTAASPQGPSEPVEILENGGGSLPLFEREEPAET